MSIEECNDTDGGKNYGVKGSAGVYEDVCSPFSDEILQEYYTVEENGKCVIKSEFHDCNALCEDGRCLPPTCDDWVRNQGEQGIDCGGPCPTPCVCPSGCKCSLQSDAEKKAEKVFGGIWELCSDKVCGSGGLQGDIPIPKFCYKVSIGECKDTDGGLNYAVPGSALGVPDQCFSDTHLYEYYTVELPDGTCEVKSELHDCNALCEGGRCLPPTCDDGIKNQGEGDIDCGGPCTPCDVCAAVNAGNYPSKFDWRDWKGKNWVSDIKDQAACGSCWAFAAIGAVETRYNIEQGQILNINLSEQWCVSDGAVDGDCSGGQQANVYEYMEEDEGVPYESLFPYQSINCWANDACTCYDYYYDVCSNPGSIWETLPLNPRWKITHRLDYETDIAEIKRLLVCHGPLSAGSHNWHHAIVIVGWDDNCAICQQKYGKNGCWIVKNSHGIVSGWYHFKKGIDVWYENGYTYIPYEGHPYSDIKDTVWDIVGVYNYNVEK